MKKYDLTDIVVNHEGVELRRIKAVCSFADVKKDQLGGFVQSEYNLSQYGDCWIYDESKVYGKATVENNAKVRCYSEVSGYASIEDNADIKTSSIMDYAHISGKAKIDCHSVIDGYTFITDDVIIGGNCQFTDDEWKNLSPDERISVISGPHISGGKFTHKAKILNGVTIEGKPKIGGNVLIKHWVVINGSPTIKGYVTIKEYARIEGEPFINGKVMIKGHATVAGSVKIKGELIIDKYETIKGDGVYSDKWTSVK